MGSLPEGTLCAYCGINAAGYIPDGCVGPLCLDGEDSCYWKAHDGFWHVVVKRRLERLWGQKMKTLTVRLPPRLDFVLNNPLIGKRNIASYLFDA